jgi:hypothetical protein
MSDSQHHTLVCSVLFLDIEAYSKKSVTEQLAIKQQFNSLLVSALRHVATDDRIILDTGDGAAVSFLSDPEDSLFAAMNMRDAIVAATPPLRVRIGINLGPVRLLKDINGQVNIIGDGINDAQRVMSFCEPGKILVSRSYYEVVSRLSDDYAHLFVYEGTHADKHVREHAVYAIGASTPEPPHDFPAKAEAALPEPPNTPVPAPIPAPPPSAASVLAAPASDTPRQGGRKWIAIAVAVVAVLALVGSAALWLGRGKAPEAVPAPPEQPGVQKAAPTTQAEPPQAPSPEKSTGRKAAPTSKPDPPKTPPSEKPFERKTPPADSSQPPKPPTPTTQVGIQAAPAWLIEMRNELSVCRKHGIVQRGICMEKTRWKYCQPSHWDRVEECRVGQGSKTSNP